MTCKFHPEFDHCGGLKSIAPLVLKKGRCLIVDYMKGAIICEVWWKCTFMSPELLSRQIKIDLVMVMLEEVTFILQEIKNKT